MGACGCGEFCGRKVAGELGGVCGLERMNFRDIFAHKFLHACTQYDNVRRGWVCGAEFVIASRQSRCGNPQEFKFAFKVMDCHDLLSQVSQ